MADACPKDSSSVELTGKGFHPREGKDDAQPGKFCRDGYDHRRGHDPRGRVTAPIARPQSQPYRTKGHGEAQPYRRLDENRREECRHNDGHDAPAEAVTHDEDGGWKRPEQHR